jgi:predicted GIY-YIG superfamily endonuclease
MSLATCSFLALYSMSLLNHLKEFRHTRSLVEKIPMYCVFGDTVMRSITQTRPTNLEALQSIRGFSGDKCTKYGPDIIKLVKHSGRPPAPPPAIPPVVVRHGVSIRGGRSSLFKKRWGHPACPTRPFNPAQQVNETAQRIPATPPGREGVYILELAQGRVYVGHSSDTRRRMHQHVSGRGSAFSKAFPPTGVVLPRLGCVTGSSEAAERDETLRYMFLRGIQLVRGWRYTRVHMPPEEVEDAEQNIRELFDLCRRCGQPGHFITRCKANCDRLGRPCRR